MSDIVLVIVDVRFAVSNLHAIENLVGFQHLDT